MAIFLGIDGGGSKTACLIGDEFSVLGRGTAGASNIVRVGEAQARTALTDAILQACAEAQIAPMHIARSCIGAAGAAGSDVQEAVRRVVAEIVPGEITVVGDMVIALEAAFGSGPGVIAISGTGSIIYGRNSDGEIRRAGGWGSAISDEGSGHWIGRTTVSAMMRAYDERQPEHSYLLASIVKFWSARSLESVIRIANSSPACDFSALFPLVLAAADAGDPLAIRVLQRAGIELARLAQIVIRQLFADAGAIPLAMSGGVFANSAIVRESFYNSLQQEYLNLELHEAVVEPVQGALALARRGAQLF